MVTNKDLMRRQDDFLKDKIMGTMEHSSVAGIEVITDRTMVVSEVMIEVEMAEEEAGAVEEDKI